MRASIGLRRPPHVAPQHGFRLRRRVAAVSMLLAALAGGAALADDRLDDFDPDVSGDRVRVLAVQPDGRVLIGGTFTHVSGQPRANIARVSAAGILDASFDPGTDGSVLALLVQPDGKLLIGGSFTQVAGQPRRRIARLNADGSLDAGFDPGADGTSAPAVRAIVRQADGKLLIGGQFTTFGGQPRINIARLDTGGGLDAGFTAVGETGSTVHAIALQADGRVLVGGNFGSIAGQTVNYLGRLAADGTLEAGFRPFLNSEVYTLVVQPDGKILAGGFFTSPRMIVARFDTAGVPDEGFDPAVTGSVGARMVNAIAVQSGGRVAFGGQFELVQGTPRRHLARLGADGQVDAGLAADVAGGAFPSVDVILTGPGDTLLVGGRFTSIGGQPRNRVARLRGERIFASGFE